MIYIATSRWFIGIASVFYFMVGVALLLTHWFWWVSTPILWILYIDYKRVVAIYGLRAHKSSVAAIMPDCGKWQYQLLSGKRFKAKLIKQHSYISPVVLILCLRGMTTVRYIVIPRDSLSKHNFRLLAFKIRC